MIRIIHPGIWMENSATFLLATLRVTLTGPHIACSLNLQLTAHGTCRLGQGGVDRVP
jgi:hypothetical protein